MKFKNTLLCLLLLCVCQFGQSREKQLLNLGWTLTDASGSRPVVLPHESADGIYSRSFSMQKEDIGLHFELLFDGLSAESQVWLNGRHLGSGHGGGLSSLFDITPYVDFLGDNTIRVESVGGICRDVYLIKKSRAHIPAFATRINANWGRVEVDTRVFNSDYSAYRSKVLSVCFEILDATGKKVAWSDHSIVALDPYEDAPVKASLVLDVPHMWDFDDPYLYTLRTMVYEGNTIVDEETIPFGIRDIVYHDERGFLFNNRRVAVAGAEIPSSIEGFGRAIPREFWRYRLRNLRKHGIVAVCCPYEAASPALIEVCDELGMLIISELELADILPGSIARLKDLISRDYNHPSVMSWGAYGADWLSSDTFHSDDFIRIVSLQARKEDPMRPVVYPRMWDLHSGSDALWGGFRSDLEDPDGTPSIVAPRPAKRWYERRKAEVSAHKSFLVADGQDILILEIDSPDPAAGFRVEGPVEVVSSSKTKSGKLLVVVRSLPDQIGSVLLYVDGVKKPFVYTSYSKSQTPSLK